MSSTWGPWGSKKLAKKNSNFVPRAKFGVFLPAHKFHAEWDNHYFMTRIFTRGHAMAWEAQPRVKTELLNSDYLTRFEIYECGKK